MYSHHTLQAFIITILTVNSLKIKLYRMLADPPGVVLEPDNNLKFMHKS